MTTGTPGIKTGPATAVPVVGSVGWSPDFKTGSAAQLMPQPIVLPPNTFLLSKADLEQFYDALRVMHRDLTEHVRLAEYNLTGKCGSDQMPIPNPPQLVHRNGIDASERALEQGRVALVALNEKLRPNWRNEHS